MAQPKLVVGPVVGLVTDDRARILLEVASASSTSSTNQPREWEVCCKLTQLSQWNAGVVVVVVVAVVVVVVLLRLFCLL